jgi:5'-3' exonuclease
MICLLDGDIIAYRCAATANDDPVDVAIYRVDKLMREIIEAADCDQYQVWISGGNNYRYKLNETYKANRKDMVPPVWRQECLEFLVVEHGAKLAPYGEADDWLGINQTEDTTIASIDKDLLTIPGKHFNWLKQQFGDMEIVSEHEANQKFFKQMLIGDTSDNIYGVQGLGPVKSGKIIDPLITNQEMFEAVMDRYDDMSRMLINANCLWIMRREGSIWYQDLGLTLPNELELEQEAMSKSILSVMEST